MVSKPHPLSPPTAHLMYDPSLVETSYRAVWGADEVPALRPMPYLPAHPHALPACNLI